MANSSDVISRYVQACQEPKTRTLTSRICYFERGSVPTLYSYGRHFPLAECHTRDRKRPLMLLNGDGWRGPSRTSSHQAEVRRTVETAVAAGWKIDVILLPFSALDAAGIVHDSIRPLEVRPDRTETIAHSAASLDDVPQYLRTRTVYFTRESVNVDDVPGSCYRYALCDEAGRRWSYDPRTNEHVCEDGRRHAGDPYALLLQQRPLPPAPDADGIYRWRDSTDNVPLERGSDGLFHWETTRHHLGDSLFTGETVSRRELTRPVAVADVVHAAVRAVANGRDYGDTQDRSVAATFERLGETITETVSVRTRRKYLSSFDMNEPAPLYFLATMPRRSAARTVDAAIMDLAPRAVHAAYARNVPVYRQGDIFAVETTMSDADIYGAARARTRLTVWDRGAAPKRGEIGYRAPLTKSQLARFEREVRDEYRKSRARYAITAAGKVRPTGKRGKPIYGNLAGEVGCPRDAYRRFGLGDAVACYSLARSSVIGRWFRMITDRERARIRETLSLHGTAHTATEVCVLPGGATYARGIMRHVPALEPNGSRWRRRDHVNVKLGGGDSWHLILRNTVPRAAR